MHSHKVLVAKKNKKPSKAFGIIFVVHQTLPAPKVGGHPKGLQLANHRMEKCRHNRSLSELPFVMTMRSISVQQCHALSDQHRRRGLRIKTSLEGKRKLPCSLGEHQTGRPIQAQPMCRHGSSFAKAGTSLAHHDMQHRLCVRKSLCIWPVRPSKILSFFPQAGHLIHQRL